ncbi:hypothetical protein CK203_105179 [Vitis vinifera]|uniref:DUF659 domain-containing protein n=1 Tax=Vitis vinifera TaxID=29760 RepID=A0A438CFP1_VITVI|nr:hypothetical protein CK203_105179 [Vitis vinifera]
MQSPMAANSGKRKKSTVDKYFATKKNTQGAQPSMSVLAGKEAIWRADMAVGRFFMMHAFLLMQMPRRKFSYLWTLIVQFGAKVGCTIMGDGWTDNRQRTLINFLVYCPEGISFVKSVDASDIVKDATNLFQLFDELIVFNLIFKDIGKMDHVAELVRRASKEILRPGATRFATTFIALKSLHDHKHDLQALVTSKFFVDSRYSKDYKSQVAVSIILDNRFWNDCLIVVNLMSPLMRLLRIVDCDERPSMGYVYEGMYRVRLGIKKLFNYNKRLYKPYTEIIKQRWDQQLKKSIHSASLLKVLKGKLETMNEMKLFRDRLGSFGRELAYSSREVLQPDDEDGGDVAIEGLDVENFGFPNAHVQSPYSNFQNERRHEFYIY